MAFEENKVQNSIGRKPLENELQWIKKYLDRLGIHPQMDEIQSILHFALLWNLFEGKVCGTRAYVDKFEVVVERLNTREKLRSADFTSELNYFKSRYVTDGKTNDKFKRLKFRKNDREVFVSGILENSLADLGNKVDKVVLALMIIVYRLRNNFFHEIKSLERVHTQSENFHAANKFLIHIIDLAF